MVTATAPARHPRPSDFRRKTGADQVRCHYVVNPRSPHAVWALQTILGPAMRALRSDYGIAGRPLPYGELPAHRPGDITYVVYGPTNPLAMGEDERAYLAALAEGGARTNIISAYPLTAAGTDRPDYAAARTIVPRLCDDLGVNALFPDALDLARGIRTNTWQDVYANVIGETIRVKYEPTQSHDPGDRAVLERLRRAHAAEVAQLARLHAQHRLWQRKPYTDGSIMFTHDGHWFVSQTMTDKTLMTADDFDLVTSFDEGRRALTYAGERLPSSDAPEFLMLSSLLSMHGTRPRLIVHFHHRDLTREPRFRDLVTDATIESGVFAAGRAFFAELRGRASDWFIIREHGMVWVGDSADAFAAFIARVLPAMAPA